MRMKLPIGVIVEYIFPPDFERNDNCGQHSHKWRYKIKEYKPAISKDGVEFIAEIIEPVEKICMREENVLRILNEDKK